MNVGASLTSLASFFVVIAVVSLIEAWIPLQVRGEAGRRHLAPNLILTLITIAISLSFNVPLLMGLAWLQANGFGLFNAVALPPAVEMAGAILVLDLAWYVTHFSMHKLPILWRLHAPHHSDVHVDVTTTVRQHPGETVIRYVYLTAFAFAAGVPPAAFVIYRAWSAFQGQFEHANIRLPQRLDTAISWLFTSPNMHKVHHARDPRFTDSNYANIFSAWDRLFGTFTPGRNGCQVDYGLDGEDVASRQSTIGLLAAPFIGWRGGARLARAARES